MADYAFQIFSKDNLSKEPSHLIVIYNLSNDGAIFTIRESRDSDPNYTRYLKEYDYIELLRVHVTLDEYRRIRNLGGVAIRVVD